MQITLMSKKISKSSSYSFLVYLLGLHGLPRLVYMEHTNRIKWLKIVTSVLVTANAKFINVLLKKVSPVLSQCEL